MGRIALGLFLGALLPACDNCAALEEKLCEDLGAEDCKIWREGKGPEALLSGRRASRGCFNARFNPMQYGPHMTGAKAMVEAMKKSREAIEKRKQ